MNSTKQRGIKPPGKLRVSHLHVITIISVVSLLALLQQRALIEQQNAIAHQQQSEAMIFGSSALSRSDDRSQVLERRIEMLETKLNSFLSFGVDPFLDSKTSGDCKNATDLNDFCPEYKKLEKGGCHLGMQICLDKFNSITTTQGGQKCLVYDFGIREEPDFGEILSLPPFNCQVYAFDPSPTTRRWYEGNNTRLKNNPNYRLFFYGAGASDGTIEFKEYNWGQVSIFNYPTRVVDSSRCTKGQCKYNMFPVQKQHYLPVRGLSSIMKELGHGHIDILKVDIEGSEYRFLEPAIETGWCQKIDQLAIEFHHYDEDSRYGHGSSPQLNMFVALLQKYCGLNQFWTHKSGGWPSNEKLYADMGITLRYTLSSFMREKVDG